MSLPCRTVVPLLLFAALACGGDSNVPGSADATARDDGSVGLGDALDDDLR